MKIAGFCLVVFIVLTSIWIFYRSEESKNVEIYELKHHCFKLRHSYYVNCELNTSIGLVHIYVMENNCSCGFKKNITLIGTQLESVYNKETWFVIYFLVCLCFVYPIYNCINTTIQSSRLISDYHPFTIDFYQKL